MLRRRRRSVLVAVMLLTIGLLTVKLIRDPVSAHQDGAETEPPSVVAASDSPSPTPSASPSPTQEPPPEVVEQGNGEWTYAKTPENPEVVGSGGQLMTYNIAVEGDIKQDAEEFADIVTSTLADERGWTGGGEWQFQQSDADWVNFTIYLASPGTRTELCGSEDTYTSCRNGDAVVVNLERWLLGVEHWTSTLDTYREYVVNHEVGHRLGEGHVVCPEKGTPSPVMAQQTYELRGCEPNAWPFVDGEYITGPIGEYQ